MATSTDSLGKETLLNAARTSMSSKIVGAEGDFFAQMVVDAMNAVKTTDEITCRTRYPVKASGAPLWLFRESGCVMSLWRRVS